MFVSAYSTTKLWLKVMLTGSLLTFLSLPVHGQNNIKQIDDLTIQPAVDLLHDVPAKSKLDTINVIIENPAGSIDKWEVDKQDGMLKWDMYNNAPRVIQYLPYPGNYGMVPQTLLSEENGGDGDPLDVVVLGPALIRGSVVSARVIGLLNMQDGDQNDDKVLAIAEDIDIFNDVENLRDLRSSYPGILEIIDIWFNQYKGVGETQTNGFKGRQAALEVIEQSILDYKL